MAKEKKGLGVGLDALFAADVYDEDESALLMLPISKVEPRSAQPREYFDEQALNDLADSIAQYGVIQPIVARASWTAAIIRSSPASAAGVQRVWPDWKKCQCVSLRPTIGAPRSWRWLKTCSARI